MPLGVSLMCWYGILSVTSAAYARFHLLRSSNNKVIDHFCVTLLVLSDQLMWGGESSVPLSTSDEKAARLLPFDPFASLEVGPLLRVFGHVLAHMQREGGFKLVPGWVCALVCLH